MTTFLSSKKARLRVIKRSGGRFNVTIAEWSEVNKRSGDKHAMNVCGGCDLRIDHEHSSINILQCIPLYATALLQSAAKSAYKDSYTKKIAVAAISD